MDQGRVLQTPAGPLVHVRVPMDTAFAQRRSVLEIDRTGAASAEVGQLFRDVWRAIGGEKRAPLRTANDDLRSPTSRAAGLTFVAPA